MPPFINCRNFTKSLPPLSLGARARVYICQASRDEARPGPAHLNWLLELNDLPRQPEWSPRRPMWRSGDDEEAKSEGSRRLMATASPNVAIPGANGDASPGVDE